jgi:hypothetical protein
MPRDAGRGAWDPAAAAVFSGKEIAAENTQSHRALQVLDADGFRLPTTRLPIVGQPRRAVPGWYALAADRWSEVQR